MVPVSHAQTLRTGAPGILRDMTKTLRSWPNRGLGLETAKRLVAEGHEVWLGARDTQRGGGGSGPRSAFRSARCDR